MSKAADSSFLDPRLQLNLSKSLRIHSKMRLPAASKDTTDSRKSIFAQGINLRTSQTSVSGGNNDAATLVMIKKLIKFKSIHDNLTSMLAENEREKLDQIKNATFAKRPTIEKDAKARIRYEF